jgi:hypothetical protein
LLLFYKAPKPLSSLLRTQQTPKFTNYRALIIHAIAKTPPFFFSLFIPPPLNLQRKMGFSIVSLMSSMFHRSFVSAGLRPHSVSVDSDTSIHCWIPASLPVSSESKESNSNPKPVILLIPGFGLNAIWHWNAQVGALSHHFDVIVPDLIFFGGSTTCSSLRSEVFQVYITAEN